MNAVLGCGNGWGFLFGTKESQNGDIHQAGLVMESNGTYRKNKRSPRARWYLKI